MIIACGILIAIWLALVGIGYLLETILSELREERKRAKEKVQP